MKRIHKLGLGVALGLLPLAGQAAGNPELGKAKALYCSTCHGAAGERQLPLMRGGQSSLADLSSARIVAALKGYRNGQQFHPMMQLFVLPLGEQDMEDIGAYYSHLPPAGP